MTQPNRAPPPSAVDETARRLERFQETGNPADLWPGLTEADRVAASRELGRVVERVLAGDRRIQLDPDNAHAAYALAVAGHTTGIGPVVGRWIQDEVVLARADASAAFARHLRHARARARRLDDEVAPALDALLAAGITPTVLKGFHTSRVLFDEPAARRMSDVDLLVPPGRIEEVETLLAGIGFRPYGPALRPYKRDWIAASVDPRLFSVELAHEDSKWTIELHTSLDRPFAPGSVATLDRLRHRVEPFDFRGRPLFALDTAAMVVLLACHCSHELDGVRLLRLFELVRAVRHGLATRRFEWGDMLAILPETGAARFTYPAFALANELAPGSIDPRILTLGRSESTAAARHTVSRLIPSGGSLDDRSVVRQLMWTSSPAAIGHRLWRAVWPTAGWRTRIRRLRHGVLSFLAPDERRAGGHS